MTDAAGPEEHPGLLGPILHGRGGLTVEYVYTGEVFTNMRGGLNTRRATEYRGIFDLMMTAELDQMGLAPGGTFFLYGQNGHGRGLTERHVGDFQVLSNIDAAAPAARIEPSGALPDLPPCVGWGLSFCPRASGSPARSPENGKS